MARKHEELQSATVSPQQLRAAGEAARADRRNFAAALKARSPAVISEIKKASPSRGVLIDDFRPAELAAQYEQGGAAALSVLTDRDFFKGSPDHLLAARAACTLPVLRKDFTVAEYHILEAAAWGADAILLIAAILDESRLRAFRELAAEFGIAALVEVHDEHELEKAIRSDAQIIGVNNRDLRTFKVSLDVSVALAPQIPHSVIRISESGIFSGADVRRLLAHGYDGFLVGEHLVKSADPSAALQELVA